MYTDIKPDVMRLLLVLAVALAAGLALGHVFALLALGLLVVIIWHYLALIGFLNFSRHGAEDNLYDLPGVINDLVREFESMRDGYQQREQKLSAFIQRFEETTSALPDAVIVVDEMGGIEWANPKASDYLGVEWPKDSGHRLANLLRYPELTRYLQEVKQQPVNRVLEVMSPVDQERCLEIRINHYGSGHLLLMARDITEYHLINRMRKDFIANASHELRTPLTVIAGYLEAFEEDRGNCPEDWAPKIAQMRQQAGRMKRLIEDLLELSRLESAKELEHAEEVRVADMLETIIREAQTLSGEQQHIFDKQLDHDLRLLGDRHDLYKAFSNLIFNAVQYTPARGRITVSWYRDEVGAHMAVKDTGLGIAEQHLNRVTERFYRVDKGRSRAKGGTGLGLAIVKHVLTRHKAHLHIQSEEGKGSLFRCDFPLKACVSPSTVDQRAGGA
jgi:two-component system phosphate regulon sensor histidine kinase PhoR